MIVRIQVRRGTSTQWTSANPVLSSGEFGYETDTETIKIGNGTSTWNTLAYLQGSGGGGADGLSAYEIAVLNGFVGTEIEWLDSLTPFTYMDADIFSGDGETEATKFTIIDGGIVETKLSTSVQTKLNSVGSGADGASAYEIAVSNGFIGTEIEWLASLDGDQGPQGIQGEQGIQGPIGETGPQGIQGLTGDTGPQGIQGIQGETGLTGPEGPQGIQGIQGDSGLDGKTVLNGTVNPTTEGVDGDFYINTTTSTIFGPKTAGSWGSGTSLIGPQGEQGIQGIQGETGVQGIQGIQGETGPQGIQGEGIAISERESNTVLFDQDYVIGNAGERTGNVVFDFTGAILGASTMMIHTDASPFTLPGIVLSGTISDTVANYIYFLLVDAGGGTEKVHVTISQEL